MNHLVSIITPSFNRSDVIDETAASIQAQTYENWEWIIVDDGSTDDSWSKIQNYATNDTRIKVFKRHRQPKGAAACRNIAIEKCNGDCLIFLDTDDILASYCLEQRVSELEKHSHSSFIIFPMLIFKKDIRDLNLLWNIENDHDEIERLLQFDPICQGTGTLWRKSAFVEIGMWNESLALWQDVELHLRAHLMGLPYYKAMNTKPDVFLRISDNSLSRTAFHSLPKFKSRVKVFKYAFEIITEQNKSQYFNGLRVMASDILLSGIRSGHYEEIKLLLNDLRNSIIFNGKELYAYQSYLQFRRMKLYKLPLLDNLLSTRLRNRYPGIKSLLGKMKYEHN